MLFNYLYVVIENTTRTYSDKDILPILLHVWWSLQIN